MPPMMKKILTKKLRNPQKGSESDIWISNEKVEVIVCVKLQCVHIVNHIHYAFRPHFVIIGDPFCRLFPLVYTFPLPNPSHYSVRMHSSLFRSCPLREPCSWMRQCIPITKRSHIFRPQVVILIFFSLLFFIFNSSLYFLKGNGCIFPNEIVVPITEPKVVVKTFETLCKIPSVLLENSSV